jgi:hypothetical protein
MRPGKGDPQLRNRYGLNIEGPPFLIGELQYRHNCDKDSLGPATMVMAGAWNHFGILPISVLAQTESLANPASNGMPLFHQRDSGIYGVKGLLFSRVYRRVHPIATSSISLSMGRHLFRYDFLTTR